MPNPYGQGCLGLLSLSENSLNHPEESKENTWKLNDIREYWNQVLQWSSLRDGDDIDGFWQHRNMLF